MSEAEDGAATDGGVPAGAETDPDPETDDTYAGVLGSFPYAFNNSESRLFRLYVVIGALLAGFVAVGFVMALTVLISNTVGTAGGTFTFVRAFYVVIASVIVLPLIGPILLVARRHRRKQSKPFYDRALAICGFLFVIALFGALAATTPPELQSEPSGVFAPVADFLYGLKPIYGAMLPVGVVVFGYLIHRRFR